MGIISCFPGGGGGVQSDWNQNDSTQPDYVKNRPFYAGDPVETVLVEESTVSFAEHSGLYMAQIQSNFEATVGETYKVYWDGTAYECTCVPFNNMPVIGNISIMVAGSDTGEPFLIIVNNGSSIMIATADTSASHTVSISAFVIEVVKIDAKYLPENLATKPEVGIAQDTAYKNKEMLSEMLTSVARFTFDKQTSGRDTFVFNGFNYYKISDFNPAPEDVTSFKGTQENGEDNSPITIGSNCVNYGLFIVVAAAGDCSIPITSTVAGNFTAPSAGLYALYANGNPYSTAGTGEFTLMLIDGLTIKSSTYGSTKKFRITVDDDYNVSATNTSDSVSKTLATTEYVDNKFSTKTASVTLAADSWTGTESPYSQEVTIDGVTANSKVDLNPTGEQLNSIATNRTILNTANDNGTVTVYAVGNKPTEDYTMQVTITEV